MLYVRLQKFSLNSANDLKSQFDPASRWPKVSTPIVLKIMKQVSRTCTSESDLPVFSMGL